MLWHNWGTTSRTEKASAESRSGARRAWRTGQVCTCCQGSGRNRIPWIQSAPCPRATPRGWVQGTPRSKCWPTCPSRFSASQQVLGPWALLSSVTCFRYFHSGRTWVAKCHLKWCLISVWPWVLLLQQRDSLLEHPHLGLVSLHHGHHLRLQLLQFVLMFLLCFLIGSH